jgi:exopolysaccharide biosynthesis polyprenyl glycosylphosphotransferase
MRKQDPNVAAGLLLADLSLTLIALYLAALGRLHLPYGVRLTPFYVDLPWLVYVMAALVWLSVSAWFSVYTPRRRAPVLGEAWTIGRAVLLSNLAFAGLLYITFRDVPRLLFLYSLLLQMIFLVGLRMAIGFWQQLRHAEGRGTRVLIIGAGKVGQELAQRVTAGGEWTLVGYLDDDPAKLGETFAGAAVLGPTELATRLIAQHRVDEVIFALPLRAHRSLEALVVALRNMPVRVRVVPDLFDLALFRATIEDFDGIPVIGLRDGALDPANRLVKRVVDLVCAGIALVLAAPLMLVIALIIRLDSAGPALFRQQRVGENGKLFTIYKFRSMRADADARQAAGPRPEGLQPPEKRPDDPRVTRVGRFLRRTSLDELPQLVNVLRGDMSLVGPRPELPWLVERYEAWQRRRFAVPPGMTGWWQVNGRSDRPMHLHTDDDLYYIQNYSPLLDLRILWRTIGVVLRGKGAY